MFLKYTYIFIFNHIPECIKSLILSVSAVLSDDGAYLTYFSSELCNNTLSALVTSMFHMSGPEGFPLLKPEKKKGIE